MTNLKKRKEPSTVKKGSSATKPTKLYCIKKYVAASSATEALRIERNVKADDCWLEETWKQERVRMGFQR